MTEENGRRFVMVPLSMAGVVCMWLTSFGLLTVATLTEAHQAADWGIWFVAIAATWTVVHGQVRMRQELAESFRLGYAMGQKERENITSIR